MSNKSKATHQGTCQVCGASQKLPGGRLSTHGYTVRWGFFSGICQGSGHLPFEESCDLIRAAIERASAQLKAVREFQAELRKPATEPKAYVSQWVSGDRYNKSCYVSYLSPICVEEVKYSDGDGFYIKCSYFQQKGSKEVGKRAEIQTYGEKSVLEVCSKLNARHADAQENIARQLEQYIRWQIGRVTNWKPGKVKALKSEDQPEKVVVSGLPEGYDYKGTVRAKLNDGSIVVRIRWNFGWKNFSYCFIKALKVEDRWVYAGKAEAVK